MLKEFKCVHLFTTTQLKKDSSESLIAVYLFIYFYFVKKKKILIHCWQYENISEFRGTGRETMLGSSVKKRTFASKAF